MLNSVKRRMTKLLPSPTLSIEYSFILFYSVYYAAARLVLALSLVPVQQSGIGCVSTGVIQLFGRTGFDVT